MADFSDLRAGYSGPEAKSLVKSLVKLTDDLTLIDFDSLKFD